MTIDQFNFAGKKAFVRVDFNVPLDENFNITDDTRMRAALPTLKKILADGGSVIIGSHLGRPLFSITSAAIFFASSRSVLSRVPPFHPERAR